MAITITNTLTIGGNATFGGTGGATSSFTTKDYIQTNPGSVVTLKAGVTYTVTGQLTITGTSTSRCTLQSDTKFSGTVGSVSANQLSVTGITLNPALASRPAGSEYLMSQSPTQLNVVLKRGVPGMNGTPVSNLNSFPRVTGTALGETSPFTLFRSFTMSARNVQIGLTAKFIHTQPQANRTLNYVTTFDIDSSTSIGILLADNSYQNRVGIPNPNLWRTVNWDSLNPLLPLVSVAYVE
jgi:hypothetical protein